MKKVIASAFAGILACAVMVGNCSAAVLKDPAPHAISTVFKTEQIHSAIIQAAHGRKWGVAKEEPGRVVLLYPDGAKSAVMQAKVEVRYKKGEFDVNYLSSYGLDEFKTVTGRVEIHRNVNRWLANLDSDINKWLIRMMR